MKDRITMEHLDFEVESTPDGFVTFGFFSSKDRKVLVSGHCSKDMPAVLRAMARSVELRLQEQQVYIGQLDNTRRRGV